MSTQFRRYSEVGLLAVAVAWLLIAEPLVQAQGTTADVVETIQDPTGAVIPGVTVTIANAGTAPTQSGITNEVENYLFTLLPAGRYRIRAELPGFQTWTTTNE